MKGHKSHASRTGSKSSSQRGVYHNYRDVMEWDNGWGILENYPRIREHFGKLSAVMQLIRPITLFPVILATLFGIGAQLASASKLYIYVTRLDIIIYASLTLALAQGVSQAFNQIADVRIDKINKNYRPIPSGKLSKDSATGVAMLLFMFTFARAFTINVTFGIFVSLSLFFGIFYSLKPLRIKEKNCWISLGWMAVSRGVIPFVAIWSVFGNIASPYPWLLGSIVTLWVFSMQSTKDFPDMQGDSYYGIDTLPVHYDEKFAIYLMGVLSVIPFLVLNLLYIWFGLLPFQFLMLNGVVVLVPIILKSYSWEQRYTENTVAWLLFYGGLFFFYILSFLCFWLF